MVRKSNPILVTGATGFIGQVVVRRLLAEGKKVRCFVRDIQRAQALFSGVEIVEGDMKNKASIEKAVSGVDAVVHLAAFTSEKNSTAEESMAVNVEGMKRLVEACEKQKVKRLIVVSSQSTKRERQGNYGLTKKLADDVVMKSMLDWTIVKPTLVYGPGQKGLFAKLMRLAETLPVFPVIGSGDYKMQPVYVDDVADALVGVLENDITIHKTYDLAGATRLSFKELLQTMFMELQQSKRIVSVPYWACSAGISTLSLVTSKVPITKDNLLGLVQETSVDLDPARRDFGFTPRSFAEGIKKTIWGVVPDDTVRVGIIGLGKMGIVHASVLSALSGVKIVALFDVNAAVRSSVYSLGIKALFFTSLDDFLCQPLDAVIVAVPPAFTASIAEKCAVRGIAMLIEKPLANSLDHARKIQEVVQRHKVVTAVGYMYPYRALVQKAKEILDSTVLGKINSFDGSAFVTQVMKQKKGWRYDKKTAGGGCVALHGSHLLSEIYFLLGMPLRVEGKLYFPYSAVEDKAFVTLVYPDTVRGVVKVSWSEPGYRSLTLGLEIIGENGTLRLNEDTIELDLKSRKKNYSSGKTIIRREDLPTFGLEIGGEGYAEEVSAFINAVRQKGKVLVGIREGYDIQRMIDAIYTSHTQQHEVEL